MAEQRLLDYVNTLQGTDSKYDLSHGNTLPLTGAPWGMTDWSPQTGMDPWFFQYSALKIEGFRATRQPSPWIGDYGQFVLMPTTGSLEVTPTARASEYVVDDGVWKPDYLQLYLQRYNVNCELTATERCSVLRLGFEEEEEGRLIISLPKLGSVEVRGRKVFGFSQEPKSFGSYFVVELDRDIKELGVFQQEEIQADTASCAGENIGAYVTFQVEAGLPVVVKTGTSFISLEQAERNLHQEVGNAGFDEVQERIAAAWESYLQRLEIEGATEDQLKTFYTCLYRTIKFPHRLYEVDGSGSVMHRSPYDGQVHDGVLYADNGFWDTYRTNYSFYSLVYPEQWKEILQGWIQAYRENGWFPQWPSPGNRGCMIGTHIDAVFADAVNKGIEGLDLETAYEGLLKDATVQPAESDRGRQALNDYLRLGYVPDGRCAHGMSSTLDYAYNDWCVAQVARKLGKTEDCKLLLERASNYKKCWDASVGFMRARHEDGTWVESFDEFSWGGPYVEGSAWQCSWAVQHDAAGLIELLGGPYAMVKKLDQMLTMEPTFHVGAYGQVIHEMTEMAVQPFGQYAHSNQPVHHVLCLYTAAGQPWKTEYWSRLVCEKLYNSGPEGFCGDEDNGEMSAWYLLNAMGLFPLTPGRAEYVLTNPLFQRAAIHLTSDKTFEISAPNNTSSTIYVQKRTLNGKEYTPTYITHQEIVMGGSLQVEMGASPNEREIKPEELPYSMSING